jgi:hypothetical protein
MNIILTIIDVAATIGGLIALASFGYFLKGEWDERRTARDAKVTVLDGRHWR